MINVTLYTILMVHSKILVARLHTTNTALAVFGFTNG